MAKASDSTARFSTSRTHSRWIVLGLTAVALAAAGAFWWNAEPPQQVPPVPQAATATPVAVDEPLAAVELTYDRLPSRSEAGYVGAEVCQNCHAGIAESYRKTSHFRTCRVPEPKDMPPGFEPGHNQLTTSVANLKFEMTRHGDEFFQTTTQATPQGERKHQARIDLVYGAGGKADDVFLSWRDDDSLVELPIVWLYQMNCWSASHFDPNSSGDFSRNLTVRCLECHNTWLQHVPGTPNVYRRKDALIGVSCESCHGPGKNHVAYHEAHPNETIGREIVQPASLSRDLQLDVCLQCHSNAINRKQPAFSYRPGQPLEDSYRTLSVKRNEDDHVANQIQYLRQSKCFQNSSEMTCTTCHDPHQPSGSSNAGSASCIKCHQKEACSDRPHQPAAVQDDCVGCHMRQYLKINVNFQTVDDNFVVPFRRSDHRIAINPVAKQEVMLNWHRRQSDDESKMEAAKLAESLVGHWRNEAKKLQGEHRYLAAIAALREAIAVQETPELQAELRSAVELQQSLDDDWAEAMLQMSQSKSREAVETLSKILELVPHDARAHGKIGTQFAQLGQRQKADEHLNAVAKNDPDDAYGHAMLGWLAYLDNNNEVALEHYQRADEVEPFEAKIQYHTALALVRLQRLSDAAERLRKALHIDPQHMGAADALVTILRQQKQFPEAIALCRRAVEQTGRSNIDVLMTLAMTYAEAGQFKSAAETANEALAIAQKQRSPKLPAIMQALQAIQSHGGGLEGGRPQTAGGR